MHLLVPVALATACLAAACSPTYNWREVRIASTRLKTMLPCKPDTATREVPMGARPVALTVTGCEAGGSTFAVASADIGDASRALEALAQWKAATLANMRARTSKDVAFAPRGVQATPGAVLTVATGQRADASTVQSQAAYFADGGRVFQAVIYGDTLRPEVVEPFFSGLQFE